MGIIHQLLKIKLRYIFLLMSILFIGFSIYTDSLDTIPDYISESHYDENSRLISSRTYKNPEKITAWVIWFFIGIFYTVIIFGLGFLGIVNVQEWEVDY